VSSPRSFWPWYNIFYDAVEEAGPPQLQNLRQDAASTAETRVALRRAAQKVAVQVQTCSQLRDLFNARLSGTAGPLSPGTEVDYIADVSSKAKTAGTAWKTGRVIGTEGAQKVWVSSQDGKCIPVHRHRVRPRERQGLLELDVRARAQTPSRMSNPVKQEVKQAVTE
jgi:hypothetical protein